MIFTSAFGPLCIVALCVAACFGTIPTEPEMIKAIIETVQTEIFQAKPVAIRLTCTSKDKPESLKFVGVNPDGSDGVEVPRNKVLSRFPKECVQLMQGKTMYSTECARVFNSVVTKYRMCEHTDKLNKFDRCESLPQWFDTREHTMANKRNQADVTFPTPEACTRQRALFEAMVQQLQELWKKTEASAKPAVQCAETSGPAGKRWTISSVKAKTQTITADQIVAAAAKTLPGAETTALLGLLHEQSVAKGLCNGSATGIILTDCAALPKMLGVPKSKQCSAN